MDFTTRLGLNKPDPNPVTGDVVDISKLNENADEIDATISFSICTSSARPPSPFQGQAILETDTGKTYLWGGSGWIRILLEGADGRITSLGLGTGTAPTVTGRLVFSVGPGGGADSQILLTTSGTAATNRAIATQGSGDTVDHWWVDFDGSMQWSSGGAGGDTTLYRSGAGQLKTDTDLVVGGSLSVAGDYVAAANAGVNAAAVSSGSDTTTSASNVNLAGTGSQTSFNITKRFSSAKTRLKVHMSANMWVSGTFPTSAMFGVRVNGADTDIFRLQIDASAGNNSFGQGTAYITGLAAGTYSIQGRWRRTSGTGTANRDTGNWLTIMAEEVSV